MVLFRNSLEFLGRKRGMKNIFQFKDVLLLKTSNPIPWNSFAFDIDTYLQEHSSIYVTWNEFAYNSDPDTLCVSPQYKLALGLSYKFSVYYHFLGGGRGEEFFW